LLMILMVGYVGVAFFPAYLFFGYIATISFVLFPVLFVIFNLTFMFLVLVTKWIVIGRYSPGRHRMWSGHFLCWWFVDRLQKWMQFWVGSENLKGTIVAKLFYMLMGAKLSLHCVVDEVLYEQDLIRMDGESGTEAQLSAAAVEHGELVLGPVHISQGSWVGVQAVVEPFSVTAPCSKIDDCSWMSRGTEAGPQLRSLFLGSPASVYRNKYAVSYGGHSVWHGLLAVVEWGVITFLRSGALVVSLAPAFILFTIIQQSLGAGFAVGAIPLLTAMSMVAICFAVVLAKWLFLGRVRPGLYSRWGLFAFQRQLVRHVYLFLDNFMFVHNTSKWLQFFLRLMGVRIGADALVGQPSKLQDFDVIEFGDGSFVAAMTFFKTWRIQNDVLAIEEVAVGKNASVGTGCLLQPGARVPAGAAAAGLSMVTADKHPVNASLKGIPCRPLGTVESITSGVGFFSFLDTCGQVLFALLSYALFGCSLVAGYLSMDAIYRAIGGQDTSFKQAFVFSFSFCVGVLVVFCAIAFLAVVVRRMVMSPLGPGRVIWRVHWRFWFVNVMEGFVWVTFGTLSGGSEVMNIILRLLGAYVGQGAFIEPTLLADPPMLRFGRKAVVRLAMVEAHAPPHGRWYMESGFVALGPHSTADRNALIIYPLDAPSRVKFGPLTRPLVGEKFGSGSTWIGSPAFDSK
jgi:acetyltransferase-like isoleucine patch superfamily enzyme